MCVSELCSLGSLTQPSMLTRTPAEQKGRAGPGRVAALGSSAWPGPCPHPTVPELPPRPASTSREQAPPFPSPPQNSLLPNTVDKLFSLQNAIMCEFT